MLPRRFGIAVRRRRTLDELVRRVAQESVEPVCRLVADRVRGMSVCEARGYVRARAAAEVRRQARGAFASQPGVDAAWASLVMLRAAERVAPLVLRQLAAASSRQEPSRGRRAA